MRTKKNTLIQNNHEEMISILKGFNMAEDDPEVILSQLSKHLETFRSEKSHSKQETKELNQRIINALPLVELSHHYLASESVSEELRPFVIQFARDLVEEYRCTTPSENALAQMTAMAYGRCLELGRLANGLLDPNGLTGKRLQFHAIISKSLDRANRLFLSSVISLRQMRSPTLEVHIKTQNAFVAQNQQVNAQPVKNEPNPYAIIEPK